MTRITTSDTRKSAPTNDELVGALKGVVTEIVAADTAFVESYGNGNEGHQEVVGRLHDQLRQILTTTGADALAMLTRWFTHTAPRLHGCVHRLRRLVATARAGNGVELGRLIRALPLRPVLNKSLDGLDVREVAALAVTSWWLRMLTLRLEEAGGSQPNELPAEIDMRLWWIATSDAARVETDLIPFTAGYVARTSSVSPPGFVIRQWMLATGSRRSSETFECRHDPFDDLERTIVLLWMIDRESAGRLWGQIQALVHEQEEATARFWDLAHDPDSAR